MWSGVPGYLVPVHTAAGPAAHAGQQRPQPAHLPLCQARDLSHPCALHVRYILRRSSW